MNNKELQEHLTKRPYRPGQETRCNYCKFKKHVKGVAKCMFSKELLEECTPCAKAYNSMRYYMKRMKQDSGKKYNRNTIKDMIIKNKNFMIRCIVVLYERQTLEEQNKGIAFDYDGAGFSRNDIQMFKEAYDLIKKGYFYSDKSEEYYKIRYRLFKYCQQLANIANKKQEQKQYN